MLYWKHIILIDKLFYQNSLFVFSNETVWYIDIKNESSLYIDNRNMASSATQSRGRSDIGSILKQKLAQIDWNVINKNGKPLFVSNITDKPIMMEVISNIDIINQLGYEIDDRGCLSTQSNPAQGSAETATVAGTFASVAGYMTQKVGHDLSSEIRNMMNITQSSKPFPENPYGPYMNGSFANPKEYYETVDTDDEFDDSPNSVDSQNSDMGHNPGINVDLYEYGDPPVPMHKVGNIPNILQMTKDQADKLPLGAMKGLNRLVEVIDPKEDKASQEERELKRKHKIEKIVAKTLLTYDKELYPYQINHTKILVNAIRKTGISIDASDTGTGKTHCALVAAKNLGYNVIIMCPKPVIAVWSRAASLHKFKEYDESSESTKRWFFCANYEQFKNGNTSFLRIKVKENIITYKWKVPEKTMIIVDECHKFKNYKTQNFMMIDALHTKSSTEKNKVPILLLSATLVDKLNFIYPIGKLTGLFSSYLECKNWIKNQTLKIDSKKENVNTHCMNLIHEHIFPKYGSRMRIAEIGDMFPENMVIYEPCVIGSNNEEINEIYKKMIKRVQKIIKSKGEGQCILVQILRARQASELLKVPVIIEMTENYINEGCSVVIFVNFNDTLEHLAVTLKTTCIVSGENPEQRDMMIAKFQEDKEHIIICNIQSGGVGISLHDLIGKRPRRSIMVPSWSAMDTQQCLGRIWRAGGKTKCIQKILYCANSIEETIVTLIKEKLNNIDSINNGSGTSLNIFNETMKRIGVALKIQDKKTSSKDARRTPRTFRTHRTHRTIYV